MTRNDLASMIVALIERYEHETGLSVNGITIRDDRGGTDTWEVVMYTDENKASTHIITRG
jgi:hypothetical protein